MSNFNQLLETALIRQIFLINESQEHLSDTKRQLNADEPILKGSKYIAELSRGLNELSQAVCSLKKADLCEIDRESIAVFLDKVKKGINDEPR